MVAGWLKYANWTWNVKFLKIEKCSNFHSMVYGRSLQYAFVDQILLLYIVISLWDIAAYHYVDADKGLSKSSLNIAEARQK